MAYNETLRKELMSRFRDPSLLELAFDRAIRDLRNHDITSEEYARKLDVAIKLHRMISDEKSSYVSRDVMASIGANLLGIFMIIKHEHVNVITSRAMNWVMKPFTRF
jgi:hypothetical protein